MTDVAGLIEGLTVRYRRHLAVRAVLGVGLALGCAGLLAWRLQRAGLNQAVFSGASAGAAVALLAWQGWKIRREQRRRVALVSDLDRALGLNARLLTAMEFAGASDPPALYPRLVEETAKALPDIQRRLPPMVDRSSVALAVLALLLWCWPRPAQLMRVAQLPTPPSPIETPPPPTPPPQPNPPPQQDQQRDQRGGGSDQSQAGGSSQDQKQQQQQQQSSSSSGQSGQQPSSSDRSDQRDQQSQSKQSGQGDQRNNEQRDQRRDSNPAQPSGAPQPSNAGKESPQPRSQQSAANANGPSGQQQQRQASRDGKSGAEQSQASKQGKAGAGGDSAAAQTAKGNKGEGAAQQGAPMSAAQQEQLKADIQQLLKDMSTELKDLQKELDTKQPQPSPVAGTSTDPELYEKSTAKLDPAAAGSRLPVQLELDTQPTTSGRRGGGTGQPSKQASDALPQQEPENASLSDVRTTEQGQSRHAIPPEYQPVFERLTPNKQ